MSDPLADGTSGCNSPSADPIHEATMLLLINKYLRSKTLAGAAAGGEDMAPAAGSNGADRDQDLYLYLYLCLPCYMPMRAKRGAATVATVTTTARASRHNFIKAAASGLLAGASFTNHESLPDVYTEFAAAFPLYIALARADAIQGEEYRHLDRHVCLDYTGNNLFSHAQTSSFPSSTLLASSAAWQPPFFDIVYKSASLHT